MEDCILPSTGDSAKFKVTNVKLHFPIVTISTKDYVNLAKQLSDERSAHWNNYETIPAKVINQGSNI